MPRSCCPWCAATGSPAALKLQDVDDETAGEGLALRTWGGDGAVQLLAEDPETGTLLLERLDEVRPLFTVPEVMEATRILAELGRRGADADARLLRDCAAAVHEVADETGDRLLHWDLHFENVLAADRQPWPAIDPKPLAGDPCFEVMPALWSRFGEGRLTRRFDLLTEALGVDRERARAWTLGRVLQGSLWRVEAGQNPNAEQLAIAELLLGRRASAA